MYTLICKKCGGETKRMNRMANSICYTCKLERLEIYRVKRAKVLKLRALKNKKLMDKEKLHDRKIEERRKKKQDRIDQKAKNAFIKRMGGVKVGNVVQYPKEYYGKKNKN